MTSCRDLWTSKTAALLLLLASFVVTTSWGTRSVLAPVYQYPLPHSMGGTLSQMGDADSHKPAAWPPADFNPQTQKLATFAGIVSSTAHL